ncbi:sigma 54-interacting transcriptional regulator [Neobacillus sp. YIM B02564]|jgi:transcriptional regulatory protein LevR|uniref:Sigma 54-interacting transcriptional regulator n=1 Tax=Neobacillus paridis TaxID=2803862 RepID=A0ABS1TR03_9BACI|nr:sigma-54-dependent transcriptional regulator [Neobacillus paridis]MBL4952335.1 sigma 54-interacting transcriptional regulator [Neobacillus paridis]
MKRIERIYQYLQDKSNELTKEQILEIEGFTASDMAKELEMLRNNVSLELNNLVRDGRVVKIKKRPVRYIPRDVIQKFFGNIVDRTVLEIPSLTALYQEKEKPAIHKNEDPFNLMIGAEGSLTKLIDQAKAAVVYPPNGLHTLILGPTGSGKTLFAHMMHEYAKYVGRMNEHSPFIVFNCADYYNNPQLLLSQLFGHVSGAFTGATGNKQGLVEKADGGILFLDEVHRLPPEGQEMIFYFMDTGRFNKLGEVERNHTSNVLIIGATTEDPSSSFLNTFLRRIPITITIPSFHGRKVEEKVELCKYLLAKEAKRVNKELRVHADVIKALIGAVTFGNVGQLKSHIQLVCAQGFLESMNKPYITLSLKTLPQEIKEGLSRVSRNVNENEKITKLINTVTIITGEGSKELVEDDVYDLPFDMYKIIEDKARLLKEEGVEDEEINKFVETDIKIHIKSFYQQVSKYHNMELAKLVNKQVLELAEELRSFAESVLNRTFNDKFIYFISLHIDGFLQGKNHDQRTAPPALDETIKEIEKEYQVASKMKEIIEERLQITLPEFETTYLAMLLVSINELNQKGKVGIVVATHGNSTASSMVEVAKELLGDYNIVAVDMPLDVGFYDILDDIVAAVREVDRGEGVLMLVDMGSLYYFEEQIHEKSGVAVKAIDMVSMPMVLDAVRRSNFLDMDLNSIYQSVQKSYYKSEEEVPEKPKESGKPKAILTICSSGQGTAIKLEEMTELFINDITTENITIIPLSTIGLNAEVERISKIYDILAAVGVKKPQLDVPFISLEKFIEGEGQKLIEQIIKSGHMTVKNSESDVIIRALCEDTLKSLLVYLNPTRAISVLLKFCGQLQKQLDVYFKNTTVIRIIVHTAFAIERAITRAELVYKGEPTDKGTALLKKVKDAADVIDKNLNVTLSNNELWYIVDLLLDEIGSKSIKED